MKQIKQNKSWIWTPLFNSQDQQGYKNMPIEQVQGLFCQSFDLLMII